VLHEETLHQQNMEAIVDGAAELLTADSAPETLDDEWLMEFFEKARLVTSTTIRSLWSRILAGQSQKPGTYSKRTIHTVAALERTEAEDFTTFCSVVWKLRGNQVPIYHQDGEFDYATVGVSFNMVRRLQSAGLVMTVPPPASYSSADLPAEIGVSYFNRGFKLRWLHPGSRSLDLGNALLTPSGEELSRICGAKPSESFLDFVADSWSKAGITMVEDASEVGA
jgi:hypothetical protein